VRLGRVLRDSAAVPTQQRVGSYEPACTQRTWEGLGDRAERGPVVEDELRAVGLSLEHAQLVGQDDDLEVLGAARTNSQTCHRSKERVQDTKHGASLIGQRRAWSTHTTEYWARTGSMPVRLTVSSGRSRHGRVSLCHTQLQRHPSRCSLTWATPRATNRSCSFSEAGRPCFGSERRRLGGTATSLGLFLPTARSATNCR